MADRETPPLPLDFIEAASTVVDAFSQLPFLRASEPEHDNSTIPAAGAVRLFGIDFRGDDTSDPAPPSSALDPGGGGQNASRFRCHYCCRKFTTSQALGGHQNAHKRERQHAKSAHLRSAAMAAAMAAEQHLRRHPAAAFFPKGYGSPAAHLNYPPARSRLGSLPCAASFRRPPSPPLPHYPSPSWTDGGRILYRTATTTTAPQPGLWRVPPLQPFFRPAEGGAGAGPGHGGNGRPGSSSSSLASPTPSDFNSRNSKNGLSLDLHL